MTRSDRRAARIRTIARQLKATAAIGATIVGQRSSPSSALPTMSNAPPRRGRRSIRRPPNPIAAAPRIIITPHQTRLAVGVPELFVGAVRMTIAPRRAPITAAVLVTPGSPRRPSHLAMASRRARTPRTSEAAPEGARAIRDRSTRQARSAGIPSRPRRRISARSVAGSVAALCSWSQRSAAISSRRSCRISSGSPAV